MELYPFPPKKSMPIYQLLDEVLLDAVIKKQAREIVEKRMRRFTEIEGLIRPPTQKIRRDFRWGSGAEMIASKPRTLKADRAAVVATLNLLIPPGAVTEIRAIEATTGADRYAQTHSGYFDNMDQAGAAVMSIRDAKAIYFIPNEMPVALLARAKNRIRAPKKEPLTADCNITRRRYLLIDTDPQRESGISATDEEHEAALARAAAIDDVSSLIHGWPLAIRADSGNGGHLLYPIDLPADEESDDLINRVTAAFAKDFDDDRVKVDQTTTNRARAWKLYGTVSCKGDNTDDRPHRLSKILSVPEVIEVVTREQLEEYAGPKPEPVQPTQNGHGTGSNGANSKGTNKTLDLRKWLDKYRIGHDGGKPWSAKIGQGTKFMLTECQWNASHTDNSAWVAQFASGVIAAGCSHNGCKGLKWGDLRAKFDPKNTNGTYHKSATNGQHANRNAETFDATTDPVEDESKFGPLIPLEAGPPPEMPAGIFTGWVADQINAAAAATETPVELAANFALASLAVATQGRFCVRPETGYFEELAYYGACGLPPGTRKTSVKNLMCNWAFKWQVDKTKIWEPIIKKAIADRDIELTRIKEMRSSAAKEKDDAKRTVLKNQAQEIEDKLQPIPITPRLLCEDVTPEHLSTLLMQHMQRMGIFSDEGGFLDNFSGRYSGGIANIDILLKAHTGSSVIQDRGSRPPAHLYRPLLSFGLAPQPSVIMALVSNKEFRRRGLPARFFFMLPQHNLGYRNLRSQPVPDNVSKAYAERLCALADMEGKPDGEGGYEPRLLSLSGKAWRIWKDFALRVEAMMRTNAELEHLTDWAGKLPGAAARIAGLLHLADHGPDAIKNDEIEHETMARAIVFAEFAIPHAKLIFENAAGSETATAERMLKEAAAENRQDQRFDKHQDRAIITARELWMPIRATHGSVKEIEAALALLIDHNYIKELPSDGVAKPGRPSRRFRFNPEVLADWDK